MEPAANTRHGGFLLVQKAFISKQIMLSGQFNWPFFHLGCALGWLKP